MPKPKQKTHSPKRTQKKSNFWDVVMILFTVVSILIIVFFFTQRFKTLTSRLTPYEETINKKPEDASCIGKKEIFKLPDDNLYPAVKKKEVSYAADYYKCNPVKRGDHVVYYNGSTGNTGTVIRGLPNDKIQLKEAEDQKDTWNIIINDKIVVNSQNKPYKLSGNPYRFLDAYIKNYQGLIPPNAVLALPDDPEPVYIPGYVAAEDFLGKIVQ